MVVPRQCMTTCRCRMGCRSSGNGRVRFFKKNRHCASFSIKKEGGRQKRRLRPLAPPVLVFSSIHNPTTPPATKHKNDGEARCITDTGRQRRSTAFAHCGHGPCTYLYPEPALLDVYYPHQHRIRARTSSHIICLSLSIRATECLSFFLKATTARCLFFASSYPT